MFNNAENSHITGGSFNITTTYNTINIASSCQTLDVLHKRVAPNAILNAGGRADEVRCHPGTREDVIDRIDNWGGRRNGLMAPMFWLSGPAGAGKSAIMQTIAERYDQRGVPHANFFFFRQDSSRSHTSALVATLLHQIILLYPSLRDRVATLLSTNPLIFDSILEIQLAQLIVAPLRIIQQSSSVYHPLVLLIDGLDECDSECKRSQQQILRAFDQVLAEHPCPFLLLVASRDESQIQAAFNKISSPCFKLYLDDQYSPKSDIRFFVNAQFEQVRQTHPLANMLDATWPSVEDVDSIVEKSSETDFDRHESALWLNKLLHRIHKLNNTFVTNVKAGNAPSLDVLYKRVAPNAILNAGGRADEVRCHPGTREEVISRIEKWGDAKDGLTAPIFWLSGPAGAGKSAIVQTIAERCEQRKIPHANFFFFRADSSRSHASPLLATLLHQILLLYPSLRDRVATVLSTNPLIFDSGLEAQLAQLIVMPLRTIQQSSSEHHPLVLLIDGLDECDSESKRSQQQILHTFDKVLAEQSCPLRLLVASRDESQIRAAFNRLSASCLQLYLDDEYSPASDIRLFVNAQFEQVKKTHPLAHTLNSDTWPSVDDINYIVEKSSGQFIYAATVMRFISDSSASPMLSLERVRGAAQLATKSPFSQLDALYTYILSQVNDQDALKDILHADLSKGNGRPSLMEVLELYNQKYTQTTVLSCLADITSIARYQSDRLLFYHASFSDYLSDQSRSGDYFVDLAAFFYNILPMACKLIISSKEYQRTQSWIYYEIRGLRKLDKLPPGLMQMLDKSKALICVVIKPSETSIFKKIYNLCACDDDVRHCRRIIRCWFDRVNIRDGLGASVSRIPFSHRP
ncbi:hypothetical protein D9619_011134 [Psilocybe cf. subviscida]|uniref:NACHT domain-containing protein n=1 Tax=Psilocybe cf. subviscida TaxID=2480587 RepID=A0A8H5BIQ3_9AGAR|nr:hypothetical protein D9619_011134 [Psilocybe cf. subviscida]